MFSEVFFDMNNVEIRARALSKVKTKIANLTAIVMVAFFIDSVLGLFSNLTGSALDVVLSVIVRVVTSFIAAGLAKVAIQTWREGNAQWSDLFICFKSRRYLLCGLYGGMIAASFSIVSSAVFMLGIQSAAYILEMILDAAAVICTSYIVFAADLYDKKPPLDMAKLGMKVLTKNVGRVVRMEINLYLWIAIVYVAFLLFFGIVGGVLGLPLRLVLFVVMGIIRWAVGGYIVLCESGLGRTLIKG